MGTLPFSRLSVICEVSKGSAENTFHEPLIFAIRNTEHVTSMCDLLPLGYMCVFTHVLLYLGV
jgi:hypothetical protein